MAKSATSRSARSKRNSSSSSIRRAKTLSASLLRGERESARGSDIRHASLDQIEEMARKGELYPTAPDAEEIELDDEFWRYAELLMPGEKPKSSVHLRLDHEVFNWFRRQGKGHLTRMNAVLRAYYEANRKKAS